MKQPKTLSIIVDSAYQGAMDINIHLYPHHPLENLLIALDQKCIADDIARDLGLESGHFLMISPVLFHTTHNDVLMMGVAEKNEQNLMFSTLKKFVEADGFKLYRYQDHLWLMEAPNMPLFSSEILPKVMHQSLKPFLDEWPLTWRHWFTEVQMLFYTQGLSSGHGVWLWGQGQLLGEGLLKPYPIHSKCRIPSHLLANSDEQSHIMIAQVDSLDKLMSLNQSIRHIQLLWQNTLYWRHKPSLWQKITNWYRQICK